MATAPRKTQHFHSTMSPSMPSEPTLLSIVVPTFNERENIVHLVEAISHALTDIAYEIVFVDDDSTDGTWSAIQSIARSRTDVRGLLRIGRKGLASAVVEGMLSCSSPYLFVMDADLQHDESRLPLMLAALRDGADVVVVGRKLHEAKVAGLSASRQKLSQFGNRIIQRLIPYPLHDPLSGFFAIRSDKLHQLVRRLSPRGFKILFDLLASSHDLRVVEIPGEFRLRRFGDTKLDINIMIDMIEMVLDKALGRLLPLRFVLFCTMGGIGLLLHLAILGVLFKILAFPFWGSQTGATLTAMVINFFNNNHITFRDRKLKGKRLIFGLLSFLAICSIGAAVNVAVADKLFSLGAVWWLAGICGAVIGAIWNYSVSNHITWRKHAGKS